MQCTYNNAVPADHRSLTGGTFSPHPHSLPMPLAYIILALTFLTTPLAYNILCASLQGMFQPALAADGTNQKDKEPKPRN